MEERERGQPYDEAEPSPSFEAVDDTWEPLPGDEPFEADEGPVRVRESPGRAIVQLAFVVLAVAVFATLIAYWQSGTADRQALWILLALLGVILLVEVILLRPIYDALFRRVPKSLAITPGQDNYIVGCPGCGTVFTVTEEQLSTTGFDCHNCGRHGYIKDYQLNRGSIKEETCRTCGNQYLEYKDHSECPVCHTYNAY